ncbi:MarR family winged helix-turn-helix transcriptional regulator [Noviherbaspirillum sp. ST9]|uniref:MarR family winged helix-turn-helix transcriptional regulator n=1 Tax=Noviherbaspirillum sp. ST9 TaxID=3401606 RepID=UPI003B58A48D
MEPPFSSGHVCSSSRNGLGYLVNSVRNALFGALEQDLARLNLTAAQLVVVVAIARDQLQTIGELGAYAGIDMGAMSRLIGRLEEKGIVRRTRSDTDKRAMIVELAPMGRNLYPQIEPILIDINRRFLQGFSAEESEQLQKMLERLLANANRPPSKEASAT